MVQLEAENRVFSKVAIDAYMASEEIVNLASWMRRKADEHGIDYDFVIESM